MEQKKINQLTTLLKRLNAGENVNAVRKEAKEFLATVDAADLSFAEQQLIDAGLEPEDLRHLCSVHMEMMSGEVDKMKATLKEGHVIHTMACEHDAILGFLDKLETTNEAIQKMNAYDAKRDEFALLKHIADHLIGAEPHHTREEEVLFPALEERGVSGPPQMMRMEHKELRKRKHEIKELAENVAGLDFVKFKKQLNVAVKFLVLTLRDHIFKENNILYPTALQVIHNDTTWDNMKEACDKIGYCCFTPKHS